MSQGQIVAGLMVAAGIALLVLALLRRPPSRPAHVKARVWSSLVGVRSALVQALMIVAGLALLLVQRLDREALRRVLVTVKAAVYFPAAAHRTRR